MGASDEVRWEVRSKSRATTEVVTTSTSQGLGRVIGYHPFWIGRINRWGLIFVRKCEGDYDVQLSQYLITEHGHY